MESKLMNTLVEMIDENDAVVVTASFTDMAQAEVFANVRLGGVTKNGFITLARLSTEVDGEWVFHSEFEI